MRLPLLSRSVSLDLAAADPDMSPVKGLGNALLWPLRAGAVKSGELVIRESWRPRPMDGEFSYDIENSKGFVYPHGVLARNGSGRRFGEAGFNAADFGSFEPVCATYPESEEQVWRAFLEKLEDWISRGSFTL